jgi:hypothetical protein
MKNWMQAADAPAIDGDNARIDFVKPGKMGGLGG